MTPYEILGVEPTASLEEIETSYRLMLRRFNPQTVEQADAQIQADAAIRLRELHGAMAQIRKDLHGGGPRTWGFDEDEAEYEPANVGPDAEHATTTAGPPSFDADWMKDDPKALVPCPHCGQGFIDVDSFRRHLTQDHALRLRGAKSRENRVAEQSVFEVLGLARCMIALLLLVGSLVAILLGAPIWIPCVGLFLVVVVLLTAAVGGKSMNSTYGKKVVKQHKAVRWF